MNGFRMMDEMERDIVSKSEKIALIFAKVCLASWCVYLLVTQGVQKTVSSWPLILLLATIALQFAVAHVLTWRINKGKNDEK
ncbi:MAG: hypothetical protein Q8865_08565 [Bacillota bacterium]|nr:hypothetical protein [Bacillota bacterium]